MLGYYRRKVLNRRIFMDTKSVIAGVVAGAVAHHFITKPGIDRENELHPNFAAFKFTEQPRTYNADGSILFKGVIWYVLGIPSIKTFYPLSASWEFAKVIAPNVTEFMLKTAIVNLPEVPTGWTYGGVLTITSVSDAFTTRFTPRG
jgi:hypothetical protein